MLLAQVFLVQWKKGHMSGHPSWVLQAMATGKAIGRLLFAGAILVGVSTNLQFVGPQEGRLQRQ